MIRLSNDIILKIRSIESFYKQIKVVTNTNVIGTNPPLYSSLLKKIPEGKEPKYANLLCAIYKSKIKNLSMIKTKILANKIKFNFEDKRIELLIRGASIINKVPYPRGILFFINLYLRELKTNYYLLSHNLKSCYLHKNVYIGGSVSTTENDVVVYDDKVVAELVDGRASFIDGQNALFKGHIDLMNILAYFNLSPNFPDCGNANFFSKVDEMYNNFNLCDLIEIRRYDFFSKNADNYYNINVPIFKKIKGSRIVKINKLHQGEILDLYHSSLKQFEPLPRCIMLFRIIEFAIIKDNIFKQDYKIAKSRDKKVKKNEFAVEYYWNKAKKFNLIPIFYKKNGKYQGSIFSKLKKEADKIIAEWSRNPSLNLNHWDILCTSRGDAKQLILIQKIYMLNMIMIKAINI